MVLKPNKLPKWADIDIVDPTSGQNNVVEPPLEKQENGWDRSEYPSRNWFNWLGRQTYRWLSWFKQQEEQSVVTNGNGVGLFTIDNSLITLHATNLTDHSHYLLAIGHKHAGQAPNLTIVVSYNLQLGTNNVAGDYQVTGGGLSPNDLVVWGQSKIIPS